MVMDRYRGTGAQFITFYIIITGPPLGEFSMLCMVWGFQYMCGTQGYLGSYVTSIDQV